MHGDPKPHVPAQFLDNQLELKLEYAKKCYINYISSRNIIFHFMYDVCLFSRELNIYNNILS